MAIKNTFNDGLLLLELNLCKRIQHIKISLWEIYFSRHEWCYPIIHVPSDPNFSFIQVAYIVCYTGNVLPSHLLSLTKPQWPLQNRLAIWAFGFLGQSQWFNKFIHIYLFWVLLWNLKFLALCLSLWLILQYPFII